MEITFIRHAEKKETGEDPFLTKKGVKQAEHLAKRLTKDKFDEFYCSDMNRAKQTAKIISKKIGMIYKIEKSLNEFESQTIKEGKSKWSKEEKEHYNKLNSFLKKLIKNPEDNKSILIVAHGITNRMLLSYFLKLNLRTILPFRQSEGGINSVSWAERFKNWRLQIWNDNNHIPKELRFDRY